MPNLPMTCVPFSSASFSPSSITGCKLWLDGADLTTLFQNTAGTTPVTTTGQVIQLWKDKSGTANNASSSSSSMTYGTSNIYFPGTQTTGFSLSPTLLPTGTTDTTWFFILNTTTNGVIVFMAQGGTADLKQFYLVNGTLQSDKSGVGGIGGSTAINTGANFIFSCLQDNTHTTLTGWQNGNQFGTNTNYSFNVGTPTGATIGTDLGSYAYTGYIAEIIVYNSSLGTPDRQTVEGYLSQKWSASGLPAGHPGLTQSLYSIGPPIKSLGGITSTIIITSVPYPTSFSPTSVGSLALWLDGKDPAGTGTAPSSGATVSTWVDKSTSAKNATAGGTPTYLSGGGITFNGSSWFSNLSFAQNLSQRSIFIVMQETVHNSVYGVFPLIPNPSSGTDYQSSTGLSVETSNGLRFYGNGGSYQSDIGNATLLVKAVYNDNMSGTAGSSILNGNTINTITAGYTAGTCSGYGVGSRWQGGSGISGSLALNGIIYEIMYFNAPLGTTDRKNVEGYLAQKWGLTSSLPANHPGLTQTLYSVGPPFKSLGGLTSTLPWTNPVVGTNPGAPTIGTATPAAGQVTVTWSAPSSNGGSSITNYIITSSPSGGNSPLTVGNVTTGTITGLPAGTTYTFTVVAVNAVGNSSSSSATSSVTTPVVPGAPTIGTAATYGSGQVTVTWTAPASNGGSSITNYIITSNPSEGTSPFTVGNVLTGTVSGLSTVTSYTFTVVAVNAVGNSLSSGATGAVIPFIQAGNFMVVTSVTSPATINYGTTTDVQNSITYSLSSIYNVSPQPLLSYFDIPTRLDTTINSRYWSNNTVAITAVGTTFITTSQSLVTNPSTGTIMYMAVHTTGSAQNNSTTLTVTSATGILLGMVIYTSGPASNKFANGTVVQSISGTTITLSLLTVATVNNGSDIWFLVP